MVEKRKNLAGSYSIPRQLATAVHRENERDDATNSETIKNSIKNNYNKQAYKLTAQLNDNIDPGSNGTGIKSIDNGGEINHLKRELEDGSIANNKRLKAGGRQATRRRRWDVTPEERELLIKAEQNSKIATIISERVPVINGLPLTDEVLDKLLPPGYIKAGIPTDMLVSNEKKNENEYYFPLSSDINNQRAMQDIMDTNMPEINGLEFFRPEDKKYFGALETLKNKQDLTEQEKNEIKVMELLLRIKNGNPSIRKKSLRSLTENSRKFGPDALFNQVLPLLVEPSLEDQERHVLVKLIGRIMFRLGDMVRPHTRKILISVSPLLIDEDFTLRLEARDIISNLCKAAGLANIVSTMKSDLSNPDEYIRNIASRILAVVANTLGLVNFLPFLKAVIKSKKSWQARHTGIKIIQQLCMQLGPGNGSPILPYTQQLIQLIQPTLSDEMLPIRLIAATTLSQMAETVYPYGIESFEPVLEPLWVGIKRQRGKPLAVFVKCLGSIIPLMANDMNYEEYKNYYTRELVSVISREFNSQDDEMRATILRVLQKLPLNRQLIKNYEKNIVVPFLRYFWNRRTASDTRLLHPLVISASSELALKLNYLIMIEKLIIFTKDDNEQLRKMAVETISRIISTKPEELIGMDEKLEEKLVDGALYAFQEQKVRSGVYLNGLTVIGKAMGVRLRPHINSILSTILYQIKNKEAEVRQQAAQLLAAMAPIVKICTEGQNDILQKLILILYESLGEVYPEVLASLLNALYSCLESFSNEDLLGLTNPSINQLLPSLSPILKNRHEKVQESCILVIGLIARKCAEVINVREWMRICFDLLDTLKSPKKRIRISANKTFGEIARTIGPQDVITMLLNNLRVQERQLRVCTAVAIGIVAEICAPFTVLPAIMNEYRTPDNNVQNGILKAMTFVFEYIDGNMTKDYLYSITSLLQDALTDRDQVHRQTAATVVKHIALNCQGCINDAQMDVFIHFMNLLLPNVFETSPHVINRILEAIDSLKNVLGYGKYMNYLWAGLFHPARKVRAPYWKLFNYAYVQLADAIVPYYPTLNKIDDDNVNYNIEEFDLFI